MNTKIIVFLTFACFLYGCEKAKRAPSFVNQVISVAFQKDTSFFINDTLYKIAFTSGIQEGRCTDFTGSECGSLCGYCDVRISIINELDSQIIILNEEMAGCQLQADSIHLFMNDLSQGHPSFNFRIGLLAVTPYPTNYDSIDAHAYKCIFLIKDIYHK